MENISSIFLPIVTEAFNSLSLYKFFFFLVAYQKYSPTSWFSFLPFSCFFPLKTIPYELYLVPIDFNTNMVLFENLKSSYIIIVEFINIYIEFRTFFGEREKMMLG